jgi:hypothetical protein
MSAELATRWTSQLFETLESDRKLASELRLSSLDASLGRWTSALTTAVVTTFDALQMPAAGKGHSCSTLPITRQEYLALDVTAFYKEQPGWQFPAAVCELENAKKDTRIAYSLWKVLCVRADLRVLLPPGLCCGARPAVAASRLGGRPTLDRRSNCPLRRDPGSDRITRRGEHLSLRVLSTLENDREHGPIREVRTKVETRKRWR